MNSRHLEPPLRQAARAPLLLLSASIVAAVLAGCGSAGTTSPETAREPRTTAAAPVQRPPEREPAPAATLPAQPAWGAGPGEVQPEVKTLATRFVETAGTWDEGEGDAPGVEGRLKAAGFDPGLAAESSALVGDRAAAASVAVGYAQYGGLTPTAASVMVTVTQQLLAHGGEHAERQTTVDVRLARASADAPWTVAALSPDPDAAPPGGLSPEAQSVLDNPRIALPGAAARDVEEGRVDVGVLQVLDTLAEDHVIDVQVFSSGHPTDVFATDRASNHSKGRAVDIWRIDGHLVVDPATPRELLQDVMREAAARGATEVGGPFDLNGQRPGFFTDLVHQDHLHIGLSPDRPPAEP